MKFISKLVLIFFCSLNLFSQEENSLKINFLVFFGEKLLKLDNSTYPLKEKNSIQFDNFKFYISDLKLLKNDKIIYQEKESFHLIDFSNLEKTSLNLKNIPDKQFDKLRFNLGIDSITNYAGALGGDLDPTKGMYWTWQNGYINIKLEGKSNVCKTRNNEFVFHLGGYQYPFNSLQEIEIPCSDSKKEISLKLDLEKLFSEIDLSKINHIMSPSLEAVRLSEIVKSLFSLLPQ